MEEHVLQPAHADGLTDYTRFLRRKRDQVIAEVAAEFRELRETRLLDDHYQKEDVEALMEGLLAILRTELKRNLQNMCHSTVLLLKQLLEQAEQSGQCFSLDLASTEDRKLLEAVALFEESAAVGSASRATGLRPMGSANLPQQDEVLRELMAKE